MHQDALEDGLELKPSLPNQKTSKMGACDILKGEKIFEVGKICFNVFKKNCLMLTKAAFI